MVVFSALAWIYTLLLFYCFIFINCYNHFFFPIWNDYGVTVLQKQLLQRYCFAFDCVIAHQNPN